MAEENARLDREAQRRLREVTTLYEASRACLSISDQEGLLTAIIEAAVRATDAALGSVMLADEKKGEYIFGAHYGLSEETIAAIKAELHIPLGEGLVGAVVTTGQPVVAADVNTDPRWIPMETKEPMHSFLGVPLVGRGRQPLGALTLSRPDVGAFDEDHVRLLSTFANQVAMAVENARLYEQAQQEITERKRAIKTLRESEERYRRLVELSFDAIAVHREGKIVYINAVGAELFGASSPEEIVGKPLLDFVHPDYLEIAKARVLQTTEGGVAPLIEEKLIRLDGTSVDAEVLEIPITYQGQPAVQVVVRDITARKRAEEEIRKLNQFQESIIETANIWMDVLDEEANIVIWNRAAEEISGYSREEVVGHSKIWEWLYPDEEYRNNVLSQAFAIIERGVEDQDTETTIRRKDGQIRIISWNSRNLMDEKGNPIGSIALGRDVTEHKQAEEALRVSEERFALAVRGSNDGIWDWDILSGSLYWSPRFKELLGYAPDELDAVFDTFESHLHPDDRERVGAAIEAHLRDQVPYDVEERLRTKSGQYRWFRARGQALWDEAGNPIRFAGSITDITERKQGEEALRKSEERFRSIYEESPIGIAVYDSDGQLIHQNKACSDMYGISDIEEVRGFRLFYDPNIPDEVKDRLRRGETVRYENPFDFELVKKHGLYKTTKSGIVYHDLVITPLGLSGEESVSGYLSQIQDITERKQAEAERERLLTEMENLAKELAVLNELGQALTARLSVEEVLNEAYRQAARLVDTTNFFIALYDPEKDEITFPYTMDAEDDDWSPLKGGKGLTGWVIEAGKPLLLPTGATGFHREAGGEIQYDEVGKPALSWLGVPLMVGDQVLGVMAIQSYTTPGLYDEHDRDLLTAIASPTAIAIQNARLFEETEARAGELAVLNELGQALTARLSVEEVLEEAYRQASRLVDTTNFYIGLYDPEKDEITFPFNISESEIDDQITVMSASQGITGYIVRNRTSVLLVGEDASEWEAEMGIETVGQEAPSWLGVPLMVGDQVLGVMVVQSYTAPGLYDEHDRDLLTAVASPTAIAIQNARLFEETQTRAEELAALREVNLATLSTLERAQVFEIMLDQLGKVIDYDTAAIKTITPDGMDKMIAGRGSVIHEQIMWDGFDMKDNKLIQEMRETKQPVLVHDTHTNGRFEKVGNWEAFRSWAAAPLFVRSDMIGYLAVEKASPSFYDEGAFQLLGDFAHAAAIALENARLYEDIRRERDYSQTLIATANALVVGLNLEGRITLFNDFCAEITGYSREEVLGRDWFTTLLPEREFLPSKRVFRELVEQGLPSQHESPILSKDGRERVIAWSNTVIRDAEGRPANVLAIGHDVTERKRAEEALRESEERYRALYEDNPSMYFTVDTEGTVLSVNQFGAEQLGYTVKELVGRSVLNVFYEGDKRAVLRQLATCLQNPTEIAHWEFRKVRKDGSVLWVKEAARAVRGADGNLVVLIVCEDITERKKLEGQLRQAQKMEAVGQLAGGIAHDFNNLLTPIGGFAELLMWKAPEESQQYEYLRQIKIAAERAAALTRRLLTFARRDRGEVYPLSLNDVAREVIGLLERTIDKAIAIEPYLADDLDTVEGDASQLHQVLLNLCLNARDAMPQGGRLIIETKNMTLSEARTRTELDLKAGQYVLLSVTDTGIGMDAAIQQHLFEPFFTTKEEGRGLGLATVYGIVRGHGGAIHVYSEPGQGSTFKVYLPVASRPAEDTAPKEAEVVGGTETVLVVDDEESVRKLLRRILEEGGYSVLLATDGVKAVELYTRLSAEIDLVVLDIIMPRMGGRETYERLREINPGVKVLLSSGYSENGQAQDILAAGARGFLQKPYDLRAVLHKVREVLEG